MHLGIDGQRLNGQRLGIGRYLEYLLHYWGRLRRPNERIDLFLRGSGPHQVPPTDGIRQIALGPALTGQLWQNLVLGQQLRRLDVLFCPAYFAPITRRGNWVLAIHSAEEAEPRLQPWHYRYSYTVMYRASARRAIRVIVPSTAVRDQIQELYRLPADRMVVIPLGVDESFRPSDDSRAQQTARMRLLGCDRPYVLFVGKLSRRRNIPMLLEAFARLVHEHHVPHALLLFGPNHLGLPIVEQATAFGVGDRVVQADGHTADHRELVTIYTGADLFVSASSYEGTSLPLLEAMSCGTPAVVTRGGAMPEIGGDAAYYTPEISAAALAEAMRQVLDDSVLRAGLRRKGLVRAEAFRWSEVARRTFTVLREAARS
jgi:glycosyltransferase involved in cell wall biosynthesis